MADIKWIRSCVPHIIEKIMILVNHYSSRITPQPLYCLVKNRHSSYNNTSSTSISMNVRACSEQLLLFQLHGHMEHMTDE